MKHKTPAKTFERIIIVGASGAGKSTLADLISRHLDMPRIELDAIYWQPDWQGLEKAVFLQILSEQTDQPRWVIDGNYQSSREITWNKADTLIFLDYDRNIIMRQLARRTFERIADKQELWNGNRETLRKALSRDSILRYSWKSQPKYRKNYPALIAEFPHLNTFTIRYPGQLRGLLRLLSIPSNELP